MERDEVRRSNRKLVVYIVQPYFFAHNHVHRRKQLAAQKLGVDFEIVSFIPRDMYREHRDRYDSYRRKGLVHAIAVWSASHLVRRVQIILFCLWRVFRCQRVVLQILRTDPAPFMFARKMFGCLRGRLRIVLEYEGDNASEYDYVARREPGYTPERDPAIRSRFDCIINKERKLIAEADGLVLMSQEHIDLWKCRMGHDVRAVALTGLFDPRESYDPEKRRKLREELGLTERIVIGYVGNVVCLWQRFGSVCQLVAELLKRRYPVHLLALVRREDHCLAKDSIVQYGLEGASSLLWCPADEVSGYLSAADCGTFLRDEHTMTKITTGTKIGEYLACGLPVITTGNNALYNDFIRAQGAGVFIGDDTDVTPAFLAQLDALQERSCCQGWREKLSSATHDYFLKQNNPFTDYALFLREMLDE